MTEMTEPEIRVYPRKVFRCRSKLSVENKPPMDVWVLYISLGGMSLMLAEPIDPGQYCVSSSKRPSRKMHAPSRRSPSRSIACAAAPANTGPDFNFTN